MGDFQGLLPVAGQPVGQGEERLPVRGDQRLERLGAAGKNHFDELLLRFIHPHGYTPARAKMLTELALLVFIADDDQVIRVDQAHPVLDLHAIGRLDLPARAEMHV